ncbi:SusE domain-containing protein [Prevotella amnii]|uniref:SusE domain-containing protein n=1 Tax=Prevotella amnii TaxID=419005 RepID=UPI000AB7CF65|nr:SusE domain-containing protein [Prevotella amnii]
MKTILKTSLALLAGVALFSACDKDMEDNPTLQTPKEFILNTPGYANYVVDLATQDSLKFTWEQPKYGFSAEVEYGMQFSASNKWKLATDKVDNQGSVIADYANVGGNTHSLHHAVAVKELAKAIQELKRYSEKEPIGSLNLYARTFAVFEGDTLFSKPIMIKVKPYYVALAKAPIETWYMIGDGIGEKSWNSVIPLLPLGDQKYDAKTGKGVISWTGYLDTKEFKIRKEENKWTEENFGQDGSFGTFKKNAGNIKVPEPGYYTVTLDTKTEVLKIEEYKGTAPTKTYDKMCIPGSYGAEQWKPESQTPMTALGLAANNHDWKATIELEEDAPDKGGLKFAAGSWAHNWVVKHSLMVQVVMVII